MSKIATITKFAAAYTGYEFKTQMYALHTLAKSLNLIMWHSAAEFDKHGMPLNGSTKYEFRTSNNRALTSVILKNV